VPGRESGGASPTRGSASAPLVAGIGGAIKHSVLVSSQRAASGAAVPVSAVPGKDVVVLHIDGGPSLVLHPENARDLLRSQAGDVEPTRGAKDAGNEVAVPVRLRWRGLEDVAAGAGPTRGFLGTVVLKAVDVVTGLSSEALATLAIAGIVKRFDGQVNPGVYQLRPDALTSLLDEKPLEILPRPAGGATSLVLIHGTFSNTAGSFGRLWSHHPDRVQTLFSTYGNRVFALDHPTLGVSPIANAITLANALPSRARLHLLTHSRGGLVAEVLARACGNPGQTFEAFPAKGSPAEKRQLRELAKIVSGKGIAVERLVRVACPARGTLLASGRLDAYLSVVKWATELAGIPAAPGFVELLTEIARRRTDPEELPGLAAQIPDSPLVQWLHSSGRPLPGDLRVVAGDIDGDSVTSWVKTLLADAFFWTDNDLVVQTRSMYGGSPRNDATFLLDEGGRVSHFNYFANDHTAGAIVNALVQDHPPAFAGIGPLSWSGASATGTRGARPASSGAAASRPAVIVVPGIFGSHLAVGGRRVWLDRNASGEPAELEYGRHDRVAPDGLLDVYAPLGAALAAQHEVVELAYDWRRPIEDGAARLAQAIEDALDRRAETGTAVRIVAHSSGGLLVRAMQWVNFATWRRFANAAGSRVLLLGPPNGGIWLPMQLLTGDDTLGNLLPSIARPFHTAAVRQMFAGFPGLMQLQADLTPSSPSLGKSATWKKLAAADERPLQSSPWHASPLQSDVNRWGIPSQPVLDAAVRFRRRLDKQRRSALGGPPDFIVMVTGKAPLTPDGFETDPRGVQGLVYLEAQEGGDGRVALHRARFDGLPAWSADADHVGLVSRDLFFEAYLELLDKGATALLPQQNAGADEGAAPAIVRDRLSRSAASSAPPARQSEALLVRIDERPSAAPAIPALRVSVINGDLTFVAEPLMLGHYRASKLTGTEWVMDRLIGGAMDGALQRGLYPGKPETHQIFINTRARPDNPWQPPRPRAVIVVGLGEEGSLRAADLTATVRQAVIAWAQRVGEDPGAPDFFTLATTLIGSGGTGVSAAESAQLIARGVREANERLDEDGSRADGAASSRGRRKARRRWPRVDALNIIELYGDRAGDAWRALQLLAASSPAAYTMTGPVAKGTGALRRPLDSGYRGADYDLITAVSQGEGNSSAIVFTIDTRRARSEVRARQTQATLIRSLVAAASNNLNRDAQIGRTLFQLLVPAEIESFLGGSTDTQLEVDRGTAGIPWELLDVQRAGSSDPRPWAIRTKLLRKLRTATFRDLVVDAGADDGVLVIGDPAVDRTKYPRLFGARREAMAVARALGGSAENPRYVRSVISALDLTSPEPDAKTVINAVLERDWRIVHVAGHGEAPERLGQTDGNPRGVVLSDGAYLGPREIQSMRTVPELVFVNCCHLAGRNINQLLSPDEPTRAEFAAGVAEALISIGVRAVIAAGWAVDDEPANTFASSFYTALVNGCRFIDAVAQARDDARRLGGNTWAAYQCYGDPDWRYRPETGDAQRPTPPADEFAAVSSSNSLLLALETLAVRSEYQHADAEVQARKIRYLETAFGNLWGNSGAVAEAFGNAWTKSGNQEKAIEWYERGRAAADGSISMAGLEQLANLYVRSAWRRVKAAGSAGDAPRPTGRRKRAKAQPRPPAARKSEVVTAALGQIGKARELLDRLIAVDPSVERLDLCGSLFKREAMIQAAAGNTQAEVAALAEMRARYRAARDLATSTKSADVFYPMMNVLAAELASPAAGRARIEPADLAAIRESLAGRVAASPDFWSVVGQTELKMCEAVAAGTLSASRDALWEEFSEHHQRVSAPSMWASVYDNATLILRRYARDYPGPKGEAAEALLERLRSLTLEVPEGTEAPDLKSGATELTKGTKKKR
jgi:tetratricopeptide (TPR) repeat protein